MEKGTSLPQSIMQHLSTFFSLARKPAQYLLQQAFIILEENKYESGSNNIIYYTYVFGSPNRLR